MVPQIVLQFGALLLDVREVDEEPRTHVTLRPLYLVRKGGLIFTHQQMAILEKAAASDLLRVTRRDQLLLQMVQRFLKVAEHRLADHRRVEILADGDLAALVEQQQRV